MKILIAEDDLASRKVLKHYINNLPNFQIVEEVQNGEELVQAIMKVKPDIVLVDIGMPLVNGMEAVKSCRKIFPSLKVIFITGHEEYAVEAFDVNAIDYIVKPIELHRLYAALEKAVTISNPHKYSQRELKKDLMVKRHNSFSFIPLEEIIFIERVDRKAVIHMSERKIELNETLTSLEKVLDSRFVTSHRSFIINLEYLTRIDAVGQMYLAYFKNYNETAKISKHKLMDLQNRKSL
jgi:two-component system, LytTR family, response regulator